MLQANDLAKEEERDAIPNEPLFEVSAFCSQLVGCLFCVEDECFEQVYIVSSKIKPIKDPCGLGLVELSLWLSLLEVDMVSSLMDMYARLPWGDGWDDASLKNVIRYLRGSRLLSIPDEWRPLLPTEL